MQHFKFVSWWFGEFVVSFFDVTNRLLVPKSTKRGFNASVFSSLPNFCGMECNSLLLIFKSPLLQSAMGLNLEKDSAFSRETNVSYFSWKFWLFSYLWFRQHPFQNSFLQQFLTKTSFLFLYSWRQALETSKITPDYKTSSFIAKLDVLG